MSYDKDLYKRVISGVLEGKTVKRACEAVKITTQTFYNWVRERKVVQKEFGEAMLTRTDMDFDGMDEIVEEMMGLIMQEKNVYKCSAIVNAYKVKLENKKWEIVHRNPRKYGDKVQIGGDPDNPVVLGTVTLPAKLPAGAPIPDQGGRVEVAEKSETAEVVK